MKRYLLLVLLSALLHATTAHALDARKAGADLTAAFYAKRIDTVWDSFDDTMRRAIKSRDDLASFRDQLDTQLGAEKAVIEESVSADPLASVYKRRVRFEKSSDVYVVSWSFAHDGKVSSFSILPEPKVQKQAAPSKHLDYRTRTALQLPFDEEFMVFWGGRTLEQNYHAEFAGQRFAADLAVVRGNATHAGDGLRNEDYYCFGKPILAPAAGEVVEVVDYVADNPPGRLNAGDLTGNRVIIDHGNGEFSMLAHLRKGSLRVKRGDRVDAGDRLGECGNSGHSSEAHLHYQLQDGPKFNGSTALPAQFTDYLADGTRVTRGEPTKGQRIRPSSQ
ncbi:peptidase M23 family protein [Lysobacter antibioticus]|uniref:M23 family metallopeptidase n=1 Tax=Lysobacter antibioticus TaxID=84531 RepID=UPI0007170213|nr:M23 family metallopeptidase [Lysobacter antibioticus]ALN61255.1 peptidase M23 family protein [Lysobacter antibioticus]